MGLPPPLAHFYEMCAATIYLFIYLFQAFFILTINSTTSTKKQKATRLGFWGGGGGVGWGGGNGYYQRQGKKSMNKADADV